MLTRYLKKHENISLLGAWTTMAMYDMTETNKGIT